jgi:hypothetical protein
MGKAPKAAKGTPIEIESWGSEAAGIYKFERHDDYGIFPRLPISNDKDDLTTPLPLAVFFPALP